MEVINQYKCELCGTVYAEKDECEKCEAFHAQALSIDSQEYKKGVKYPQKIEVLMSHGGVQTYYHEDCLEDY